MIESLKQSNDVCMFIDGSIYLFMARLPNIPIDKQIKKVNKNPIFKSLVLLEQFLLFLKMGIAIEWIKNEMANTPNVVAI